MIYTDFSEAANISNNYQEFIDSITRILREDLHEAFPEREILGKGCCGSGFKKNT
ncbi:MAG: hypothetical protein LUH00_00915 [Lachnospiraceae bacterium]|nr:hypothetical protein [Lachnospiraceae bacterium]